MFRLVQLAAACLAVGVVSLSGLAWAQETPRFERFLTADGLNNYSISALAQDAHGFLWVGTMEGVSRYDGYTFRTFKHIPGDARSLAHNFVNLGALLLDAEADVLWIGTRGGLSRLSLATETFTTYRHHPAEEATLSSDVVSALARTPDGTLWAGTVSGLNRYRPETDDFAPLDLPANLAAAPINALAATTDGVLWVGTSNGLCRFEPATGRMQFFGDAQETPGGLGNKYVTALHVDGAGALWVGTRAGLYRMEAATEVFTPFFHDASAPSGLATGRIFSLEDAAEGGLWVGMRGGGLTHLDPTTGGTRTYRHDASDPLSLPNDEVTALLRDRSGTLWAGTWFGLGKKVSRKAFRHITHPETLQHRIVRQVLETRDGALWIGTRGGGLTRIAPETGQATHFRHDPDDPNSLSVDAINSLSESADGTLWIGTTRGGVDRLDPATGRVSHFRHNPDDRSNPNNLGSNSIYSVYEDREGVLWVGTVDQGLYRRDPGAAGFVAYRPPPADAQGRRVRTVSHRSVWPILQTRDGTRWVGTYGGGLNRYDASADAFIAYQADPTDPHALRSNQVTHLFESDGGTMWVGTMGGGLSRYDPTADRFTTYTTEDGLPHMTVLCIAEEIAGRLWIGTSNGLARLDPVTGALHVFNAADGLRSPVFFNGCARRANGEMLFGSADGLTVFHPERIRRNLTPPPVALTRIDLFDDPAPLDTAAAFVRHVRLRHDENFVAFHFAALDFTDPSENTFAYRLEGVDRDWVQTGTRHYASYPQLEPGRYVFRVRAANGDGVWNERGASVRLTIVPPVWQRLWFRLLMGLSLAGLLWLAHRRRIEQALYVERLRVRIADDLHDDMGSKVSALRIVLDTLSHKRRLDPHDWHQLSASAAVAQKLVHNLRDAIWAVDAGHDTLAHLIDRMRETTRLLFHPDHYHFEAPDPVPHVILSMEQRAHLFMIFKEALHNAARHAEADFVVITVKYVEQKRRLTFYVEDDGHGFDPETVRKGRGLRSMAGRAERLGATLSIESKPSAGTQVCLVVRLDPPPWWERFRWFGGPEVLP